jgi:hypothetical protein
MHLVDQQSTSTFTTQEYARLVAYRAAVLAGFYTDWDGSASGTDTRLLARLRRLEQRAQAQPFSTEERQRLARLRKRLIASSFDGDGPPAEAGSEVGEPGQKPAGTEDAPGR